jgi:hypothetical protein
MEGWNNGILDNRWTMLTLLNSPARREVGRSSETR